mmetsp:Transcript_43415/g.70439  ORF Transcript_43415/g.70439 Transcript_43415/m.70439 type:complete len:165 (-) Transcript_43415:530-1024(-)
MKMQQTLKAERDGLQDERLLSRMLVSQLHQIQSDTFEVLKKLVFDYRMKRTYEYDWVMLQWLVIRCRTMNMKLMVLKAWDDAQMYTKETVPALRVARQKLDKQLEEANNSLNHISMRVRQYESLGGEFDKLVRNYVAVLQEMERQQFSLRQFQGLDSTGTDGPS